MYVTDPWMKIYIKKSFIEICNLYTTGLEVQQNLIMMVLKIKIYNFR